MCLGQVDRYYKLLEVDKDASVKDITAAYRKLSLKVHPDRPGGSDEAFKEVNRAYEVLKDESKRENYNRFGLDVGFDQGAEDLASEMMTHTNRALGVVVIRTAITATVIVAMRHMWPRALTIAACGCAAVYGRLANDANIERVGFRLVIAPLAAWVSSALNLLFLFDLLIIALASGLVEISESNKVRLGILGLAAVVRWFSKARIWFFFKLLAFEIAFIPISFIFFQLAGHVANEILKHALDKLAVQVRAEFDAAQAEISRLKSNNNASNADTSSSTGPYRRNKKHSN